MGKLLKTNNLIETFQSHPDWEEVEKVCNFLSDSGHIVHLAGGCVRDALLRRNINDFDIATSASPNEVEKVFFDQGIKTLDIGKKFGVIAVVIENSAGSSIGKKISFEIASFRNDISYSDSRHPDGIEFSNPAEDAKRRDFTINALFYDIKSKQVIDHVGGVKDLTNSIIKTVGNPEKRFSEDLLRILRAIRFAAQLGMPINRDCFLAIKKNAHLINQVSKERITEEVKKIFLSKNSIYGLNLLLTTGLWNEIFSLEQKTNDRHSSKKLFKIKRRLKILSETSAEVKFPFILACIKDLDNNLDNGIELLPIDFKERLLLSNYDKQFFASSLKVFAGVNYFLSRKSDGQSDGELIEKLSHESFVDICSLLEKESKQSFLSFIQWKSKYTKVLQPNYLPEPLITGKALLEKGVSPGKKIGVILKKAYHLQLEGKPLSENQIIELINSK